MLASCSPRKPTRTGGKKISRRGDGHTHAPVRRRKATLEDHGSGGAFEPCTAALHLDPGTFADADDRGLVLFMEFLDALLTRLAHVLGRGVGIDVVRIDLERNQAECVEAGRVDDRHVVRRPDRRPGHVRAGAGAQVRHRASVDPFSDDAQYAVVVHHLEESEGVATPDEDGLSMRNDVAVRLVFRFVNADHLDPHLAEALAHDLGVLVPVLEGVGDEHQRRDRAEEGLDRFGAVFQEPLTVTERVADQEEPFCTQH